MAVVEADVDVHCGVRGNRLTARPLRFHPGGGTVHSCLNESMVYGHTAHRRENLIVELRLYEKYRPKSLAEVVGQPVVGQLQEIAERPFPLCVLIEGPTGTGKTTAGVCPGPGHGLLRHDRLARLPYGVRGGLHGGDGPALVRARDAPALRSAGQGLPRHGDRGTGIPQSHRASAVQGLLRAAAGLDEGRAGSHQQRRQQAGEAAAAPLPQAVFTAGKSFAVACNKRLAQIWAIEAPHADMPHGWEQFGWDGEEFSFRQALDTLDCYLNVLKMRARRDSGTEREANYPVRRRGLEPAASPVAWPAARQRRDPTGAAGRPGLPCRTAGLVCYRWREPFFNPLIRKELALWRQ